MERLGAAITAQFPYSSTSGALQEMQVTVLAPTSGGVTQRFFSHGEAAGHKHSNTHSFS